MQHVTAAGSPQVSLGIVPTTMQGTGGPSNSAPLPIIHEEDFPQSLLVSSPISSHHITPVDPSYIQFKRYQIERGDSLETRLEKLADFMSADRFKHLIQTDEGTIKVDTPRRYSANDLNPLISVCPPQHTLARETSLDFWNKLSSLALHSEDYVFSYGVNNADQLRQAVEQGLEAGYVSGWTIASSGQNAVGKRPDLSLWPYDQAEKWCGTLRNVLNDAEIIENLKRPDHQTNYQIPLIIDVEAYSGLKLTEMVKGVIKEGGSAVHLEDQSPANKKCGHMGGKSLIPIQQHIDNLKAIRLQADRMQVPLVIIARTDSRGAELLTQDSDNRDKAFLIPHVNKESFLTQLDQEQRDLIWQSLIDANYIHKRELKPNGKLDHAEGELTQKGVANVEGYKLAKQTQEDLGLFLGALDERLGLNNIDLTRDIITCLSTENYLKTERVMTDVFGQSNTVKDLYRYRGGIDAAINRALAIAPYCDLIWVETPTPDLDEAEAVAQAIHEKFPDKMLAYNLSPSFNWEKNLKGKYGEEPVQVGNETLPKWKAVAQDFQKQLATMGYKYQFITLAGHHVNEDSASKFTEQLLAKGMRHYAEFQSDERDKLKEHQANTGSQVSDRIKALYSGDTETTTTASKSDTSNQFKGTL